MILSNNLTRVSLALATTFLLSALPGAGAPDDWASSVIAYLPVNAHPLFTNALSVLGPAARFTPDSLGGTGDVPVRVNEAVWTPDQIVSIGFGGSLILEMGGIVTNEFDPVHPYDVDLIVYGNAFFSTLNDTPFASPWFVAYTETAQIWVGQSTAVWFRARDRFADSFMPTQSVDINGNPSDYLFPVNPNLLTNDWTDGSWSYTNTVLAYEGSAGGTPVDLSMLETADGSTTNLAWIRFVKFIDVSGQGASAEIDAVARVPLLPEPTIPALLLCIFVLIHSRAALPACHSRAALPACP